MRARLVGSTEAEREVRAAALELNRRTLFSLVFGALSCKACSPAVRRGLRDHAVRCEPRVPRVGQRDRGAYVKPRTQLSPDALER